MEHKDVVDSWEFEGPVDFIKQLRQMREIPRSHSVNSSSSVDPIANDVKSKSSSNDAYLAVTDSYVHLQGISPSVTPKPVAHLSVPLVLDATSGGTKPAVPLGTLQRTNPPLPPGPAPVRFQPPLPPGPPPRLPSQALDFRKAAPLPASIRAPAPPPASVTAFKTPPPYIIAKAVPTPAQPVFEASGSSAAEKPRVAKRARGMSLSSNFRRTVDSYDRVCQVGGGTYGDVFKARDRDSGEIVALKKVRLEDEKEGFPVTALREIRFLSQVNHSNIVKLKEVVTSRASETTRNKGSVFMVFEYAECDLVGFMKMAKNLNESHVMCLVKQILQAVHYAHVNHILHRDIKPSNVLLNSQGIVKVADWGLCKRWAMGSKYTNRVVTLWYRAPELLLGEQEYTPAIDMWAVGCLMAELLIGRAILPGKDEVNQLKLIFELCGKPSKDNLPKGWEALPLAGELVSSDPSPPQLDLRFATLRDDAKDLLVRLLELDPAKRISAKDALDHDWFWGQSPSPCDPKYLPVPKGDGLHEYQLREEAARQKEKHADAGPATMEKKWRHDAAGRH